MITKKTDRHAKKAQSELDKALQTNRLKAWEQNGLKGIKSKLDAWIESYGRPELS